MYHTSSVKAKKLGKDRSDSLSRMVYETMIARLLGNDLVPGDILNRRDVAEELGVSVAPVLEAFLQLDMEGFVESLPRKGTVVKAVRKEDVLGRLIIREALECEAARLYCGEPVAAAEKELVELAEAVESTPSDTPEHWKQDIDFHLRLVSLAGCDVLTGEFAKTMRIGTFYGMNRVIAPDDRLERQNHVEMVERLKTRDPDEAERIVRAHVRSGKVRLFDDLKS